MFLWISHLLVSLDGIELNQEIKLGFLIIASAQQATAAAANSENNGEASTGKKRGVPKGTKRGPYNKKTKTK